MVRIYTRRGDDGTTGLLYGGRVGKDAARIELNGALDEAQAALGMSRAEAEPGSELDAALIDLERQLYVVMAEVATAPSNRHKLVPGESLVTAAMVAALEGRVDDLDERVEMPSEFVLPGANRSAAALDLARTLVRRAERVLAAAGPLEDLGPVGVAPADAAGGRSVPVPSHVGPYLNRLSDLLWMMARWQEGPHHLASRVTGRSGRDGEAGDERSPVEER